MNFQFKVKQLRTKGKLILTAPLSNADKIKLTRERDQAFIALKFKQNSGLLLAEIQTKKIQFGQKYFMICQESSVVVFKSPSFYLNKEGELVILHQKVDAHQLAKVIIRISQRSQKLYNNKKIGGPFEEQQITKAVLLKQSSFQKLDYQISYCKDSKTLRVRNQEEEEIYKVPKGISYGESISFLDDLLANLQFKHLACDD